MSSPTVATTLHRDMIVPAVYPMTKLNNLKIQILVDCDLLIVIHVIKVKKPVIEITVLPL